MSAIRNAVQNKVESSISGGLRKVVGGILGTSKSSSSMPVSAMRNLDQIGKYSTKHLSYPLNVADDPKQGHYIMFNINALNRAKISVSNVDELKEKFSSKPEQQVEGLQQSDVNDIKKGMSKNTNSVYKEMYKSSKRLDTVISLYMPPSVQVNYSANYGDQQVGLMADTGLEAFKAFTSSDSVASGVANAGEKISTGAGETLKRAATAIADTFAPGVKTLAQIEMGQILGNQMELMFEGVGRRAFTFTFIFIPKSERESQVVDQIIKKFKFHMLPSYVENSRRAMTIPDMFDITYMYKGGRNEFLNKISTCFLESADVTYGGDRFTAYDTTQTLDGGTGAPPQRTTLALSFKEVEIMTRDKVLEGF
jgi:hypothetical protein